MDLVILFSRLILGSIFTLSAITKLFDQKGTRVLLKNFGIPAKLIYPIALLLPITELIIAILLLPVLTALWGTISALILLSAFTFIIVINLWKGNTPECHCFGQMSKSPISWKTLFRNLILISLGVFILSYSQEDQGFSVLAWLAPIPTFEQIQIVLMGTSFLAMGILCWITLHLWRQQGRLLLRLDAIEASFPSITESYHKNAVNGLEMVDKSAPTFTLPNLFGSDVSLEDFLIEGKEIVLLFLDPGCGPCNAILPYVSRWQKEFPDLFNTIIISKGTVADNGLKVDQYQITNLLLQSNYEVAQAYQVGVTPSAIYIRKNGRIGSPVIEGAEAINKLVAHIIKESKVVINSEMV